MFLVIDLTKTPSHTAKLNDTKDVRDVVIGITGSERDGGLAYDVASHMGFGERYCHPYFEVHCVMEDEEKSDKPGTEKNDLGLRSRRFTSLKHMEEIANNAIDALGGLFNGRDLYDALSVDLKMSDAEILSAGLVTLKEFMEEEQE